VTATAPPAWATTNRSTIVLPVAEIVAESSTEFDGPRVDRVLAHPDALAVDRRDLHGRRSMALQVALDPPATAPAQLAAGTVCTARAAAPWALAHPARSRTTAIHAYLRIA
jgi:hypothetical protein